MNLVILMGRLTKDPDIRKSQSGTTVASYSIAVDRKFKREGEPTADFFNLVSFGKQGEFVEKYLRKGTKIVVSGTLQNNEYTNREGVKNKNTQILVSEVEFAESKGESKGESNEEKSDFLNIPDTILETLPFS
jgi:single-strand DNA-binding protein